VSSNQVMNGLCVLLGALMDQQRVFWIVAVVGPLLIRVGLLGRTRMGGSI